MDLSGIKHPLVKGAIDALQKGDVKWFQYFIDEPILTDDGKEIPFKNFFDRALGTEKFLTIDKIEKDGLEIYGRFDAGQWGVFPVFFKFHENDIGKFNRLDIGQY